MDILPEIDPDVDCRDVDPIHQKRSLAFLNHFILRTATFMNTFAKSCESKLMTFEEKLQKINASVCILESKLASIPELNQTTLYDSPVTNLEPSIDGSKLIIEEQTKLEEQTKHEETEANINHSIESHSFTKEVDYDPIYEKFFKMLQFGVPEQAVRLKIKAEGLDPDVLSKHKKFGKNDNSGRDGDI